VSNEYAGGTSVVAAALYFLLVVYYLNKVNLSALEVWEYFRLID